MSHNTESFFLTLLSNGSMEYYPENTLANFSNKMPKTLDLNVFENEVWYAAVTDCSFTTIKKGDGSNISKIFFHAVTDSALSGNIIEVLRGSFDFFKEISHKNFFLKWKQNDQNFIEKKHKEFDSLNKDIYTFFLQQTNNEKYWIKMNHVYTANELFDTIFSQIAMKNWSLEIEAFEQKIKNIQTKNDNEKSLHTKSIIKEVKNLFPNYVCIYTDIIEPRILGGKLSRAMVMYPMRTRENQNEYPHNLQIKNIQYCRVDKNRITDISVMLADETGAKLNFIDSDFSTMIVIHFQKSYIKEAVY